MTNACGTKTSIMTTQLAMIPIVPHGRLCQRNQLSCC
ncbi:hypothetical protein ANCDUO_12653 [Ancylostoma duodenale]|uniref:Uncharacterized protein n=1 Tax=Ancylostoma duodenale TaxID=51022 RepID=A0A0C2CKV6_9BILA|nr:hypothetical protein ANCDUO_12653 [Ancylostoma duodenale]